MKAFVSYSFNDSELYVVTLLIDQLRKSGYIVDTSSSSFLKDPELKINGADYFIGIITNNSSSVKHVIKEWNLARKYKIKNILVIEEGVNVEESQSINFIRFNRKKPDTAINKLLSINSNKPLKKTKSNDVLETVLIAGGIIIGVAALIALLSKSSKK